MAKISMRIVPYQNDTVVQEQLREYLRKNAPPTVTLEVNNLASAPAAMVDRNTKRLLRQPQYDSATLRKEDAIIKTPAVKQV